MTGSRRVVIVRYHDGAARTNWGGRATSLALAQIVGRRPQTRVSDVVNGIWLTKSYDTPLPPKAQTDVAQLEGPARTQKLIAIAKRSKEQDISPIFDESPRERAARLMNSRASLPALDAIVDQFEACDAVVVNGEGDFILSPRRSLWRCLVIMEIAGLVGRPVHLVNAMLSRGPNDEEDQSVVAAVGSVLRSAASVSLRDRESLRLAGQLYPDVAARFCPDALFTWSGSVRDLVRLETSGPLDEGLSPGLREALDRPYVAVSGGSLGRTGGGPADAELRLETVLAGLASAGASPVVVATCTGDNWLLKVAERLKVPHLSSDVPLAVGAHVLGRAEAFLSGRYHPSILAALAGTPCVFMRSNSHKTRSLPELLESEQTVDFPFFNEEQDAARIIEATIRAKETAARERDRLRGVVDRLASQAEDLPLPEAA